MRRVKIGRASIEKQHAKEIRKQQFKDNMTELSQEGEPRQGSSEIMQGQQSGSDGCRPKRRRTPRVILKANNAQYLEDLHEQHLETLNAYKEAVSELNLANEEAEIYVDQTKKEHEQAAKEYETAIEARRLYMRPTVQETQARPSWDFLWHEPNAASPKKKEAAAPRVQSVELLPVSREKKGAPVVQTVELLPVSREKKGSAGGI